MGLLGLTGLVCVGCRGAEPERVQNTDTAMGTVVQQNLYVRSGGEKEAEEILKLLRVLEEQQLSRRLEGSEVWNVNAAAGSEEGCPVSPELEALLEDCLSLWKQSEGAFDVTLGEVVALWDMDGWASGEREGVFTPPDEEALQDALGRCGSGRLELAEGRLFLPEGMKIDLGAVGKGAALDCLLGYLAENEKITGAVISVGGSVLTYGEKPDGSPWKVGIRDPRDSSANMGVLTLEGQWCVSTSGDYERFVEVDGVRYHHILDPATGRPADSGTAGVTVLSRSGFDSDALSTACFILGPEKGMKLAERYGVEVLFVGTDGSIRMSPGMEAYFRD